MEEIMGKSVDVKKLQRSSSNSRLSSMVVTNQLIMSKISVGTNNIDSIANSHSTQQPGTYKNMNILNSVQTDGSYL